MVFAADQSLRQCNWENWTASARLENPHRKSASFPSKKLSGIERESYLMRWGACESGALQRMQAEMDGGRTSGRKDHLSEPWRKAIEAACYPALDCLHGGSVFSPDFRLPKTQVGMMRVRRRSWVVFACHPMQPSFARRDSRGRLSLHGNARLKLPF